MKSYFVVAGIVRNRQGKILLLQKNLKDKAYPGKWSFCSGYVKEFEAAEDSVLREIKEETGLDATIAGRGHLVEVHDPAKESIWLVMCYLCSSPSSEVTLCHENIAFQWISPIEITSFDTVPGLEKDLKILGLL